MIDTDKYEGHTEGPWRIVESDSGTGYGDGTYYLGLSGNALITELSFRSNEHESHPDVQLMADAPLLLEEVKRWHKIRDYIEQIVQAFYEYREACCFDHCEAWMLESGHRVMVKIDDDEQSEWRVEVE